MKDFRIKTLKANPVVFLVVASLIVASGILGYVIANSRNAPAVKVFKSAKKQGSKKVYRDEKSTLEAASDQTSKAEGPPSASPSAADTGVGQGGEDGKLDSGQKLPTLRFYNAYRARTFWLADGFKGTKKTFTVAFRLEGAESESAPRDLSKSSSSLVPVIQWESRPKLATGASQPLARGRIIGHPHKNIQVLPLPPEAWHMDGQGVDVEMSLQWQPEGGAPETFTTKPPPGGQLSLSAKQVEERATLKLRSIDGYLKQNPSQGILLRFTDTSSKQTLVKPPAPQSQWLTSWGHINSAPGALSVTLPPGTSSQTVAKILQKANDFQLSPVPWPTSQDDSAEVWIQEGKQVLSLKKRGTIRPETTEGVGKTLSAIYPDAMRFRGSMEHYACDLKEAPEPLAQCLKQSSATNFQLYSPTHNPPFIAIKRNIVQMPTVQAMLIKEGRYLFTEQVEVLGTAP